MKKAKTIVLLLCIILTAVAPGCGKKEKVAKIAVKNEEVNILEEDIVEIKENEQEVKEEVQEEVKEDIVDLKEEVKEPEKKKEETQKKPVQSTPSTTPTVTTPAPEEVKPCEHWYQPVETEEYEMIKHYVYGSNCCGYPLFEIVDHDAVNIPDLYVHPDYHDEESGIDCTLKFTGWHSECYYQGYCYTCHEEIQLRSCTVFTVRAEKCVQNEGTLGAYEKVEEGAAYIKSCDCGKNLLMWGSNGKGLMIKKEQCSYCGDIKMYP